MILYLGVAFLAGMAAMCGVAVWIGDRLVVKVGPAAGYIRWWS